MMPAPGERAPAPLSKKRTALSNLSRRLLTGAVALPLVLLAGYAGGWWLVALVAPLACVGVVEFCMLGRNRGVEGSAVVGVPVAAAVIVGVHLAEPGVWLAALLVGGPAVLAVERARGRRGLRRSLLRALTTLAGVVYVAVPAALLVATRNLPDGFVWLLTILFLTWGTDTLAYVGGRLWGRTPLAPAISPNKTVEGAVIGVVGGIAPTVALLALAGRLSPAVGPLLVVGPLLAIVGDLLESSLKRLFQVKDSHLSGFDILPGHGGVLDRVDGLILVTLLSYFYLTATGLAG